MALSEGLSRLIADIYIGAHDVRLWDRTMTSLGARLSARWLMVAAFDRDRRAPTGASFYGLMNSRFAAAVEEYAVEMHRHDPINAFAANHPNGGELDSRAIVALNDDLADNYVRWNRDRLGSAFWRYHQAQGNGIQLGLSLHRTIEDGPLDDRQAQLLRLVFGHMDAAVRLAAQPLTLDGADPLIVLNAAGYVITANEPAERLLAKRDGIMIVDGCPRATDRRSARALDEAIRSAVLAFVDGGRGGSAALQRARGSPLLATVSPMPSSSGPLPSLRPAALIRVIDPADAPANRRADWKELFGFTPAETRLAEALLIGNQSLRHTAGDLGIAYATARIQLASLFGKTGVASQMQLVRLLLRVG